MEEINLLEEKAKLENKTLDKGYKNSINAFICACVSVLLGISYIVEANRNISANKYNLVYSIGIGMRFWFLFFLICIPLIIASLTFGFISLLDVLAVNVKDERKTYAICLSAISIVSIILFVIFFLFNI